MVQNIKKIMYFILLVLTLSGCSMIQNTQDESEVMQNDKHLLAEEVNESSKITENSIKIPMDSPLTLHPIYNTKKSVEQTLYLLFEPLVIIKEDGSVTPNIAKAWEINDTQNIITLTIHDNIKWHDGTILTTEDIAFTLDIIKSAPETAYRQATDNLVSTEIVNSTTMKLIYKQPFSSVEATLFFPVIPRHIYNVPKEEAMKLNPVGSGPYKYDSMIPLKYLNLVANSDYFKSPPQIRDIKVVIVPNQEAALSAFEQGLIDVVYTDIMEWGKYAKDKNSTPHELTSSVYEFIGLNFNKSVFQNKNVRKALLYGLDRKKIVNIYYLGHAEVTDTPISPKSYLFDKTLNIKDYDKEEAKLLLMQEGYEKTGLENTFTKDGKPLTFSLLVNSENAERIKVAKEIKRMYEEVGIEVTIEEVDKDTYLSRIYAKQYDAFLGGWQFSYALDLSFAFHSSEILAGDNFISYRDEKMDTLLSEMFLATDATKTNIYSNFQKYFSEQNPYISLYFKNEVLLTKKKIRGDITPTPTHIYNDIQLWQVK